MMNEEQKKTYIAWLNDAYAMEEALVKNLKEQIKDARKAMKEEVAMKLEAHLEETNGHAEALERILERHGEDPSKSKEAFGKISGYLQGLMHRASSDSLVKNAIAGHASEHFEMAAYVSLIAAANMLGDEESAEVMGAILEEEEMMAEWLRDQIAMATEEYLSEL